MKKIMITIFVFGFILLGLTGCGTENEEVVGGNETTKEPSKVTYNFENLKDDLTALDSSIEINQKSASMVGATEGYGYIMTNCTFEVYKYDEKSEQYKKAEKEQKITMPSFEMTFDAVVKNGYAYTMVEGSCDEATALVEKLN